MENDDPLLKEKKNVNPYRHGLSKIYNRFKWDLKRQSWISRAKLKEIYNSHLEEKAVILCNGPSLLKTDFDSLKNVYTFGLNKINLLFDKTDYRPNAIVAVNSFVVEQNQSFFNETNISTFLDSLAIDKIAMRKNITFLHGDAQVKFARDISMSLWQGNTVTTVALQLAYHMGFKEVALIGCDHNFAHSGSANKTVIAGEKDDSHFDPNYFAGGVKWQLPDLMTSEYGYSLARETFTATGRKLYNCTDGGKLEILERKNLKDFINE